MNNCTVIFRNGDTFYSQIDPEKQPLNTVASRMTGGGFIILTDDRWGKSRSLLINLADVTCIVVELMNAHA